MPRHVALLLIVLAAAGCSAAPSSSASPSPIATETVDASPSMVADGRIAFSSERDGNPETGMAMRRFTP